jgi:cytochrome c553
MKKLLAAGLIFGLLNTSAFAMPKGDATAGQTKAAACGACHGPDGNSMAPTFPRLAGQHPKYIYKQLQDFKAGRRMNAMMQGMAAPLADQDMADIAAYFASQTSSVNQAKPDLVKKGERLFRGGNPKTGVAACSGCHSPDGKGHAAAAFPRIGGQHADYIKAQLMAFRAAGRDDTVLDPSTKRGNDAGKPGELGPMQMVAAKLSDKEIEALASYISGLH